MDLRKVIRCRQDAKISDKLHFDIILQCCQNRSHQNLQLQQKPIAWSQRDLRILRQLFVLLGFPAKSGYRKSVYDDLLHQRYRDSIEGGIFR